MYCHHSYSMQLHVACSDALLKDFLGVCVFYMNGTFKIKYMASKGQC